MMISSRGTRLIGALLLAVAWTQLPAAENPAFIRTIYLVRHGAYLPDPKIASPDGPGLSPLGIAQARLVATRLRSMPIAFDSVTSSTMNRAKQTAAIVHEQIADAPAVASRLIAECTPPARAPLRDSTAAQTTCKQQLDKAFAKFFTPASGADRNDVLVCHGNVIRYLTTKALGVDPQAWIAMSVAHASVTIIQVQPDRSFRIIAVGDAGHIPANLQSWGDDSDPNLITPEVDFTDAER